MLSLNQTLITWGCVHKSDRTQRGHLIHLIAKWYVFQLKRHSENSTQARAHIPRLRKNMYSESTLMLWGGKGKGAQMQ